MNKKNISMLILIITFSTSALSKVDQLKLPEGFVVDIVAESIDSPRQMAETKNGHVVVGSKKGDKIIALIDNDKDGFFEKKVTIAEGLQNPTGVAYFNDDLYFAEIDTIWKINNIDDWIDKQNQSLPAKELYMNDLPSETWHGFKFRLEFHVIFV